MKVKQVFLDIYHAFLKSKKIYYKINVIFFSVLMLKYSLPFVFPRGLLEVTGVKGRGGWGGGRTLNSEKWQADLNLSSKTEN